MNPNPRKKRERQQETGGLAKPKPVQYITLEGEDYEERRSMEAKAREVYCRPENREQRKRDIQYLAGENPKIELAADTNEEDPPCISL